jgi:parvulin-like peptidyl-prolyl isomerase
LAQMRQTYKAQMARVMEIVIDNELLEQAAKKAGVTVTDKELADEVDSMVKRNIEMTGLSAEDFAKKVERRMGKSMKDLMAEAAADPARRRLDLLRKLSRREFPNDVKVTDDEIKEYYDKNLEQRFKQPERVRASHILLGTRDPKTRQPMSEEAKKEQRKKAEEVLAKLKKPGADFAALAKEYSTDPGSKDDGGDLGFFSREVMVPEFSEAAFKTKVGQMTDIVETQHGYHIIKVTGHKDAETEPLDKVKSEIRDELEREKIVKKMPEYREELRKPAKIEYPPGKKPASLPATPPPMSRPAMGLPSGHPPVQGATTRPARTIRVLPQGNPQSNPPKANPAK